MAPNGLGPPLSRPTGWTFWANRYLEIMFSKFSGVTTPLNCQLHNTLMMSQHFLYSQLTLDNIRQYKFPNAEPTEEVTSWGHLKNPYCWLEAAAQIFYSLSLGKILLEILITLNNNITNIKILNILLLKYNSGEVVQECLTDDLFQPIGRYFQPINILKCC